ncbi:MAG TPA: hypothetical protein VHT52_04215 [Stellaceae bacterium]|jgi:hypothetical protein|nr:hypothetical protein [Stellaceae bacterium]
MTDNLDNGEAQRFEAEYEAKLEREADEALERIQRGQSWLDWVKVAQLFAHGRKVAMLNGHANKPEGKGYNLCFSAWLDAHPKLRSIDKATRNHAMQCVDHLDAIEAWRATLGENQRQTINHPTTVLRRFTAAQRETAGEAAPKKQSEREALREANATLEGEVTKLKRKIEQGGENLFAMSDTAKNIAMTLAGNLSAGKLGDLCKELAAELTRKRKAEADKKRAGPRS